MLKPNIENFKGKEGLDYLEINIARFKELKQKDSLNIEEQEEMNALYQILMNNLEELELKNIISPIFSQRFCDTKEPYEKKIKQLKDILLNDSLTRITR